MRFMIMVRANAQSEAEPTPMPSEELMAAMATYHEELAQAGVLLDGSGLQPSKRGWRIRYEGGKRPQNTLSVANLTVDKARREARIDDQRVDLRTKEFDLLVAFAENPGIALTRDQLLESVWGYDYAGETRTVDVHVQHLRSKLNGAGVQIETLRGVGYKLLDAAS